jgi:hypothetical protein
VAAALAAAAMAEAGKWLSLRKLPYGFENWESHQFRSCIRISLFAAAALAAAEEVVVVTLEVEPGKLDSVPNHLKNQSTGIQRTPVSFREGSINLLSKFP